MPKKFKGENSKAAVARERKSVAREAEEREKKRKEEDEYWKDEDKHVMRKQGRKVTNGNKYLINTYSMTSLAGHFYCLRWR
jgi:hypothetical protein